MDYDRSPDYALPPDYAKPPRCGYDGSLLHRCTCTEADCPCHAVGYAVVHGSTGHHPPEGIISVDVEADGPVPGLHSMLSLGAAAFTPPSEQPIARFEINLSPLEGAGSDPDTMAWWAKHQEAWAAVQEERHPPGTASRMFISWLSAVGFQRPVFVGWPATYDFAFVNYYLRRFTDHNPFGIAGLDIKTLAWSILRRTQPDLAYRAVNKRMLPASWTEGLQPHTHRAVDDAIGQGQLFCRLLRLL